MAEKKVARDAAEQEFNTWAEAMDLAAKFERMQSDDTPTAPDAPPPRADVLSLHKNIVIDAISEGRLACDVEGQFVYTPRKGDVEPLTFFELNGAKLKRLDTLSKSAERAPQATGQAMIAEATNQKIVRIEALKASDLTVCDSVLSLFLVKF